MEREQGWENAREQGAKGENVKGEGSKVPPNRASMFYPSPGDLHLI